MKNEVRVQAAKKKYRKTYDRLYVASMKAGSREESEAIDAAFARANAEYESEMEAAIKPARPDFDPRIDYPERYSDGRPI